MRAMCRSPVSVPSEPQEDHLGDLAVAVAARIVEAASDALQVRFVDQRQQEVQRRVVLLRPKQAQGHGIALHHHAEFVHHHQRQRHIGEQRLEAFRGAFCGDTAVAQGLVLGFQLGLVAAQFLDQLGQ